MIDKETLRTARRTVERNGYTVLPPREKDERELDRFRTRRAAERDVRREQTFKDEEQVRTSRPAPRPRYRDVVEEEPVRRFKPLRSREGEDEEVVRHTRPKFKAQIDNDYSDIDNEPVRPARSARYDDENDVRPARRVVRQPRYEEDDYEDRPVRRPVRREMNDDEKLGAAIRTAEENGFTIRKMSKLDQAKQVARDNGFDVRKIEKEPVEDVENKSTPRTATTRPQRPLLRNKPNAAVDAGIRTRTAPDKEIKNEVPPTETPAPTETPVSKEELTTEPKKPTYADDFMNRAARFFGDDDAE